jgi:hypothetical protein
MGKRHFVGKAFGWGFAHKVRFAHKVGLFANKFRTNFKNVLTNIQVANSSSGDKMNREREVVLFKLEYKKVGYSFKIIARLRENQNILYVIRIEKEGMEPIELWLTLTEMHELGERLTELSGIARTKRILDSHLMDLIEELVKADLS